MLVGNPAEQRLEGGFFFLELQRLLDRGRMLQEWWLEGWRSKINRSNERKERLKKRQKMKKKKRRPGADCLWAE